MKQPKPRNPTSRFFISCFTVSVTPSINKLESSIYFMILIPFIFSLKMNKVNPFSALTTPFLFIFLSKFFITFEVILLTDPGKLSLAKGIATIVSAFLPKLPN